MSYYQRENPFIRQSLLYQPYYTVTANTNYTTSLPKSISQSNYKAGGLKDNNPFDKSTYQNVFNHRNYQTEHKATQQNIRQSTMFFPLSRYQNKMKLKQIDSQNWKREKDKEERYKLEHYGSDALRYSTYSTAQSFSADQKFNMQNKQNKNQKINYNYKPRKQEQAIDKNDDYMLNKNKNNSLKNSQFNKNSSNFAKNQNQKYKQQESPYFRQVQQRYKDHKREELYEQKNRSTFNQYERMHDFNSQNYPQYKESSFQIKQKTSQNNHKKHSVINNQSKNTLTNFNNSSSNYNNNKNFNQINKSTPYNQTDHIHNRNSKINLNNAAKIQNNVQNVHKNRKYSDLNLNIRYIKPNHQQFQDQLNQDQIFIQNQLQESLHQNFRPAMSYTSNDDKQKTWQKQNFYDSDFVNQNEDNFENKGPLNPMKFSSSFQQDVKWSMQSKPSRFRDQYPRIPKTIVYNGKQYYKLDVQM